jgi:hypothetical protein
MSRSDLLMSGIAPSARNGDSIFNMTTYLSSLFRLLVLVAVTAWATPSRADVLPGCTAFDALITCAEADVGKPCQGGGQCYAVSCGTGTAPTMTIYKCDACPAILSAPDAGCEPSKFGTACGDGGMCSSSQAYCNTSSKYFCAGPVPPKPTGPPVGESGGGNGGAGGNVAGAGGNVGGTSGNVGGTSGNVGGTGGNGVAVCPSCKSTGGCDVAPRATGPGAIALGLLIVGMAALFYDRRRKRRR